MEIHIAEHHTQSRTYQGMIIGDENVFHKGLFKSTVCDHRNISTAMRAIAALSVTRVLCLIGRLVFIAAGIVL
jgi:hypothetical protein